jgi:DNA-binding beta-propeller fold protein YncE
VSRPSERRRRGAAALSVAALTALIMAATALAVTGQLTQLPGTAGCVSEDGTGGDCADGKALDFASGLAISPDGKSVYVASLNSDAVTVFQRDTTTGELTQLPGTAGCVSETGSGGACADGKALDIGDSDSMTVSGDGKNLYVASQGSGVAVFARDTTTGELTQLPGTAGCVSPMGSGGCAVGKALYGPFSVAESADGKNVYVASEVSDAVAVFARDTTTGELTQLAGAAGCIRETGGGYCRDGRALDRPVSVAVSGDDKHVYVGSFGSGAVAVLTRNTTTGALFQRSATAGCNSETGTGGACVDDKALAGVFSLALSADDKNVYVASLHSNAVAAFRRNTTTGALTQLANPTNQAGCVSETGTGGACADGKALSGPISVAVSADGESVYVGSIGSDAVAVFQRNATGVGGLTQLAGMAGCVSETGTGGACADGKALDYPRTVAVSADGKDVYVTSGLSDAVAVFARQTLP